MKRRRDTQSGAGNAKKRVTHDTFTKWQRDFDRECRTMTWLHCETGTESGKKIVEKLKCRVCTKLSIKFGGERTLATNGSAEPTLFALAMSATTPTMTSNWDDLVQGSGTEDD